MCFGKLSFQMLSLLLTFVEMVYILLMLASLDQVNYYSHFEHLTVWLLIFTVQQKLKNADAIFDESD